MSVADLPAYYVFAQTSYTMFVYDGGKDDHQVHLHSDVRLFNPFPLSRSIAFTAHVDRIIQYQRDFIILATIPRHLPHAVVLLAVRYEKLGGVSGYISHAIAKVLTFTGYIYPNNFRIYPVEDAMYPLDMALRSGVLGEDANQPIPSARWIMVCPSHISIDVYG